MFTKYFEQLFIQLKDTIIVLLTTLSVFLGPVNELITGLALLCFTDFFTGLFGAHKTNTPITSKKMGDTLYKIALYGFVIIVVHYLDSHFINNVRINFLDSFLLHFFEADTIAKFSTMKFAAGVAFLITIRELKSIDENWEKTFQWSFIKTIKNVLSFFNKFKIKEDGKEKHRSDET